VPGTCVIGLQWGDEAKGKLVDILTEEHEIVVRYAGGANAGHTVVSDGQTWKLSIIPSGILRDGVACVVTGGVVLDPAKVIDEMRDRVPLKRLGRAEDIAQVYAFLASDQAAYINGAVIEVSGGLTV
jgi:adenylosuccinate synthase